ncbi:fimbrial protein [Pectobacterium sp. B1J-3]|uniref:fimbrial protein n=1 Tax=Pectobacterium sp. B1J-3 TaxID=3385371 RepID=UPI0039068BDF
MNSHDKMAKKIGLSILSFLMVGTMVLTSGQTASQPHPLLNDYDVTFRVLVVNAPCNISTESKNIEVNMGETSGQYMKKNGYGEWHDFAIHLVDCAPDTYQHVTVNFLGKEEPLLPKRLALDHSSSAKGVALGIYHDNKLVGINDATDDIPLHYGTNTLQFSARIEKIRDDLIHSGDYTATANFKLSYL